jgi:hypothetical protein
MIQSEKKSSFMRNRNQSVPLSFAMDLASDEPKGRRRRNVKNDPFLIKMPLIHQKPLS